MAIRLMTGTMQRPIRIPAETAAGSVAINPITTMRWTVIAPSTGFGVVWGPAAMISTTRHTAATRRQGRTAAEAASITRRPITTTDRCRDRHPPPPVNWPIWMPMA